MTLEVERHALAMPFLISSRHGQTTRPASQCHAAESRGGREYSFLMFRRSLISPSSPQEMPRHHRAFTSYSVQNAAGTGIIDRRRALYRMVGGREKLGNLDAVSLRPQAPAAATASYLSVRPA
jgi:hypothetical protein